MAAEAPGHTTAVGHGGKTWRYRNDLPLPFDPAWFDQQQLERKGQIKGQAGAGRGNTLFLDVDGNPMVLRRYRRGGLAQRVSDRYYVYTGIERTRPMREFADLLALEALQLPVTPAVAVQVQRRGGLYEGALLTRQLDGQTLAEWLLKAPQDEKAERLWRTIGATIRLFHQAGVDHADLNAHNLLIQPSGVSAALVSLLDFDRCRWHRSPAEASAGAWPEPWMQANINRLQRSIDKLTGGEASRTEGTIGKGFQCLVEAWRDTPSRSQ